MPTYKFKCIACTHTWEEMQPLKLNGESHVSTCAVCKKEGINISFGGSGTLLKGKHMNKYLEGFPDQTSRINAEADKDAIQMEKEYDANVAEQYKKGK